MLKEVRVKSSASPEEGAMERGVFLKDGMPGCAENTTEARGQGAPEKQGPECHGFVSGDKDLGFTPVEGGGEHVIGCIGKVGLGGFCTGCWEN